MKIKPERTDWEPSKREESIRYIKRKQEEKEADQTLNDYIKRVQREEEDYRAPPD